MSVKKDPCIEAARLREIYDALISGEAVTEARFGEDFQRFAKADPAALLTRIREFEEECAAMSGGKPRRRARAISGVYRTKY